MRNRYETLDNGITLIQCNRLGRIVKVPISTAHLERAKEFPNTWLLQYSKTSRTHYVYGKMRVNGKLIKVYLHVWLTNPKAGEDVDHVNHIGTDNRSENLKPCSKAENIRNVLEGVIFAQGLGLDGLIWNNSRFNGELYWMSVYFKDIYLGRYVDYGEALFIRRIAILVAKEFTDEQIFAEVPAGHKTEDVQRRINYVRKTFKMPDPSKPNKQSKQKSKVVAS